MRIVVDALSARDGGGRTYLRNLLVRPPADAHISVLAPPGLSLAQLPPNVERVPVSEGVVRPLARAAWGRAVLPRLLRKLGADVLFCPGGTLPVRPPHGCLSVTMSRNMIPFDRDALRSYPMGYGRAKARLLQDVLLRSMISSDLVIFVSRYGQEVVQRYARGRIRRSLVIPHGVNDAFRLQNGLPPRAPWLPDGDYVLYVSSFEPYKAHRQVVQAFAELRRRGGADDLRLVLVGREACRPYAAAVRSEIGRLGLADRVILTGGVPYGELPAAYGHARVGVFASECENCPNILLEALAAGLPMAVSDRPPMPEFGDDAVVYFNSRRPGDIADRLHALLSDADARRDMSDRAQHHARQYDWDVTAQRTWDAIRAASSA